jgi:hypothetical protein
MVRALDETILVLLRGRPQIRNRDFCGGKLDGMADIPFL